MKNRKSETGGWGQQGRRLQLKVSFVVVIKTCSGFPDREVKTWKHDCNVIFIPKEET